MTTPLKDMGFIVLHLGTVDGRRDKFQKEYLGGYLAVISFAPFWWRFWQCLHKAYKSKRTYCSTSCISSHFFVHHVCQHNYALDVAPGGCPALELQGGPALVPQGRPALEPQAIQTLYCFKLTEKSMNFSWQINNLGGPMGP